MRRSWSTVVAALAFVAVAGTATPASAIYMTSAPAPGLSWQDCGDQDNDQCTTIKVPVDWSKPAGATFDLAVARLPATDPRHRIGVLFVNPGGPGASGIDFLLSRRYFKDGSALRKRFDIVSWDPRGVGRSHPVQCSQDLLDAAPADYPATEADYRNLLVYNARLGADCRAHTGALFDHVDTVSTVRDMDALRAALGERTVSYYGVSYGTLLGQEYAELFPGRVRAMTLDSNMDHSITSAYRYLATATHDFEGSFGRFADWCARTTDCALHGQDVRAVWDDLYARAERGRLTDPETGEPITAQALRLIAFEPMYNPATWPGLATRLAKLTAGVTTRQALGTNSYQAIWCQDWKWNVSGFGELQRYRERLARIAPHTRMSEFWTDITSCLGWPAKVTNPQHRLSIRTPAPILVTASRYDVATPNVWSRAVARQVRDSRLLHYDGVGHGDYRLSSCAQSAIDSYLTKLRLPARGTHCPAVWPTGETTTGLGTPARPVH